jgi:hypothetical protein
MRRTSSTVACVSHAHARGGLVQAQDLRLGGQRDADLEIALLAVREIGGQLLLLVGQADGGQHRARAVEHVGVGVTVAQQAPGVTARLRSDAHVLEHGRPRHDVGDLVRAGQRLARDLIGGQARDVLAVEQDPAPGRPDHAGEAVEERRFARAIPDDGDLPAGPRCSRC